MRDYRADIFSGPKIKKLGELKKIISGLKSRRKKIVFTNGCFDLLHYGHVRYLEDAASKGDVLVVALNSDKSIRRIKGKARPILKEKDRLGIIAALASVDYAILFNQDTPIKIIKAIKPDVLIKGSDWDPGRIIGADFILSYGGRVTTAKLIPGRSTTNLIKTIAQRFSGPD